MKHAILITCDDASLPRLQEFHNDQAGTPDDTYGYVDIVARMKECGWEVFEENGRIGNMELGVSFNSWEEALFSCIEVASGV